MSSFSLSLFRFKLSLCWFHPLFFGVFLTFLSVRSWHVCERSPTALCLSCRSLFLHAHPCGGREPTPALCTQTWQSVTDTEANANNGSNACGKMRKRRGVERDTPASCSLTYTLASTYKYIHKALLPWQRAPSYLGMVPFPMQKQFIKKRTCPPQFPVSCQPVTADWFPPPAVNGEGLCLLALFCQLIQPTEEVGRSQQWTSLAVARSPINLETIGDGFLCNRSCLRCCSPNG